MYKRQVLSGRREFAIGEEDWIGEEIVDPQLLDFPVEVPVGIVNSSWGGSSVEAWMSEEALQKFPRQLRSEEHTSELQSQR